MAKMFGFDGFSSTKGENHQEDAEEATYKQFLRKREFK
jgi:U4/U6.U5 small nuclear ribonucleoproteins